MKIFFVIGCCLAASSLQAQELFTFTEPASNMPVKSIAVRANNYVKKSSISGRYFYNAAPELMFGISKKLMLHAEVFLGNEERNFKTDGGSLYLKFRFFTSDEVHSHFRMAIFGRASYSNLKIEQPAYDAYGNSSGAELGIITTKLANRTAVSGSASFIKIANNGRNNKFPFAEKNRNAAGYSLSLGHLVLPVEYKNYNQTNVTGMLEFLGQTSVFNGDSFIDMAPSIQCIILSKIRVDAGYRFALIKKLNRMSNQGFLVRLEYNFFNVLK